MTIPDSRPQVLFPIEADVTFHELKRKIRVSGDPSNIFDVAERVLDRSRKMVHPKAVYRWCRFEKTTDDSGRICVDSNHQVDLDFGYSCRFLAPATHTLVSVFTAGEALEQASMNYSSKGDFLESYLTDLVALAVLEKAEAAVKAVAEDQARQLGWGVGPFLSPGSVHGWELVEQTSLCSVLPLEKIDVSIQKDGVLTPFRSLSCLIGLGPGYEASQVGSTCKVCAKNQDCRIKEQYTGD